MSGHFITIEGSEGVGKTTNINFIREYLEGKKLKVTVTREPGGSKLAEEVRALLLNHRQDDMADDAELLLMFAARAEHLHKVIRPALKRGEWVISDRFTDATYAYQGGGRGISMERIAQLENWVQGGVRPELTLLLDAPVSVGLKRVGKRGELDRFEKEKSDFFERVRNTYLERARILPQRFRVIDATCPLEEVQSQIKTSLDDFFK
ncbi:MAG TPA: dTMP kinase [Gammaproteobacteria bacterium]|nr:dTMP kinase [Gammaproteobacteria bacterium]